MGSERNNLFVGRGFPPSSAVEHCVSVDAIFEHRVGQTCKVTVEFCACLLCHALLVDELHKVTEKDSVEQSAVAVGRVVEHSSVVGHIFDNVVCRQNSILEILFVVCNKVKLMCCAKESADVVCENPVFLYLSLLVYMVVNGARLSVEKHTLLPRVYFNSFVQVGLFAFSTL